MKKKQTTLSAFLNLDSESESSEESQYHPSPQKSVLKLPEMWTRVKPRHEMSHSRVKVFDIDADLEKDKVLKQVRAGAVRGTNEVLFDPDEYKGRDDELTKERQALKPETLLHYARLATKSRAYFTAQATAALPPEVDGSRDEVGGEAVLRAPALKRQHLSKPKEVVDPKLLEGDGHHSSSPCRVRLKRADLSAHR